MQIVSTNAVFIKMKTQLNIFGLRDRDFLTDSEIIRIKKKYPNYHILTYYCIENYLYHPDNIEELDLQNFNKEEYIAEIIKQKSEKKNLIISNYKNARKSYQEFQIEHEKLQDKSNEHEIIKYLESDEIDVFFKAFSMKDYFNRRIIEKYQLKSTELAKNVWFKQRIFRILQI